MFDDIECKVVKAAETPDRDTQQEHIFSSGVPKNDQAKGKHSNNEEKEALEFDPSKIRDVFHNFNASHG
jgi:hypothetical protein